MNKPARPFLLLAIEFTSKRAECAENDIPVDIYKSYKISVENETELS